MIFASNLLGLLLTQSRGPLASSSSWGPGRKTLPTVRSPHRIAQSGMCSISFVLFSSVELLGRVWLFVTPWTAARQASLSITNFGSLLKLMFIESVMPSNYMILCHPLLPLPSIFPSIRIFSNESVLIRWPKYCSFDFSISLFNEYSGLISFRMYWLDLLAVQGTLKSLLHHHSSNASIFLHSAFFMVQFSHPYMTTGKAIALTRWTFVDKVMSLLFNMLSRLVIASLPRSKRLLISWLQSPSVVILEPRKIKSDTVSTVYPSIPMKWCIVVYICQSQSPNSSHLSFTLWYPYVCSLWMILSFCFV